MRISRPADADAARADRELVAHLLAAAGDRRDAGSSVGQPRKIRSICSSIVAVSSATHSSARLLGREGRVARRRRRARVHAPGHRAELARAAPGTRRRRLRDRARARAPSRRPRRRCSCCTTPERRVEQLARRSRTSRAAARCCAKPCAVRKRSISSSGLMPGSSGGTPSARCVRRTRARCCDCSTPIGADAGACASGWAPSTCQRKRTQPCAGLDRRRRRRSARSSIARPRRDRAARRRARPPRGRAITTGSSGTLAGGASRAAAGRARGCRWRSAPAAITSSSGRVARPSVTTSSTSNSRHLARLRANQRCAVDPVAQAPRCRAGRASASTAASGLSAISIRPPLRSTSRNQKKPRGASVSR